MFVPACACFLHSAIAILAQDGFIQAWLQSIKVIYRLILVYPWMQSANRTVAKVIVLFDPKQSEMSLRAINVS